MASWWANKGWKLSKCCSKTASASRSRCPSLALQLRSSFYKAYAQRLASWGYAVVQYDTGMFPILTTAAEVRAGSMCTVLAARLRMLGDLCWSSASLSLHD